MARFSVVIPIYNEEAVIRTSYARLTEVMRTLGEYELIFVDDGSADGTLEILRAIAEADKRVKIVSFSRNFGQQEAVSAGLAEASGDAVIIIDADMQDPPEVIPDMVKLWEQGADVVYGKRMKRQGETVFKKLTAWAFYRTLHLLGAQRIPTDTGDFRIIDMKVVKTLNQMPENHRFLRGMAAWSGYKQVPYEYVRDARLAGETKYTVKKMVKLAGDGVTSFSNRPLRMPLVAGLVLSALAFVYLVVSIVLSCAGKLPYEHFLFAAVFLLLGMLFISIGVLGIYVGRIYDETKGRPLYLVREKINFDKEG